jgi:hypothetical protein
MKTKGEVTLEMLLLQGLRLGRWIIMLEVAIIIFLGFKFRLSTQIENDVVRAQSQGELTQKTLLDFMKRTVDRWDELQKQNPELDVPEVKEPKTPLHDLPKSTPKTTKR